MNGKVAKILEIKGKKKEGLPKKKVLGIKELLVKQFFYGDSFSFKNN